MSEEPEVLVRITNNTSRILGLPPAMSYGPKALVPGGNNIPLGHLEALSANKTLEAWHARGWLTVEDHGETDPEGPPPPPNLLEYGEEGAIKLVELENDPTLIEVWREEEDRVEVVNAMTRRIQKLRS